MGLFQTLKDRIFKSREAEEVAQTAPQAPQPAPAAETAVPPPAAPAQPVDVEAVLTHMATKAGQKLNWRESIVDLMKLVGMDSSLAARRELAQDLGYTGDMSDSAAMNIWLHAKVMERLAQTRA